MWTKGEKIGMFLLCDWPKPSTRQPIFHSHKEKVDVRRWSEGPWWETRVWVPCLTKPNLILTVESGLVFIHLSGSQENDLRSCSLQPCWVCLERFSPWCSSIWEGLIAVWDLWWEPNIQRRREVSNLWLTKWAPGDEGGATKNKNASLNTNRRELFQLLKKVQNLQRKHEAEWI